MTTIADTAIEIAALIEKEIGEPNQKMLGDVLDAIDVIASHISPASAGMCSVCTTGELHLVASRPVVFGGIGEATRVDRILKAVQQLLGDDLILVRTRRLLELASDSDAGKSVPTLEKVSANAVPFYICTNPECHGLTFSFRNVPAHAMVEVT